MASSNKSDNFLESFRAEFTSNEKMSTVDLLKIWYHYDKDKSGYIDGKELESFLRDLVTAKGKMPTAESLHKQREEIMKRIDANNDGQLEISEFEKLLPVEENFMFGMDIRCELSRDEFNQIFKHYDQDGSGFIDETELLALLRDICVKKNIDKSASDLEEIRDWVMKVCDHSNDGRLSREELGFFFSINKMKSLIE